jgi:hypothetical protein
MRVEDDALDTFIDEQLAKGVETIRLVQRL